MSYKKKESLEFIEIDIGQGVSVQDDKTIVNLRGTTRYSLDDDNIARIHYFHIQVLIIFVKKPMNFFRLKTGRDMDAAPGVTTFPLSECGVT